MVGPILGAAVDHVRLRAAHRDQLGALAALTHREREVLALVADGRTNRDIADVLYIEARTVEKHVEHIRAKLGARSRAEAAARWARATLMRRARPASARPTVRLRAHARGPRPSAQCVGVPWWNRRRHSPSMRCQTELRLAIRVTPSSG